MMEINHENPDYTAIKKYMFQFGEGNISLKKEYWNEYIALLEINNEGKRNAISGKMMVELSECLFKLENWKEGKAVIIYGYGKNFCAGGDLDFARSHHTEYDAFCLSALMMNNLYRLRKLPMISISMIHGPTVGGGAEIAIQSDFVIACEDIKFGFVHGNMGISTAWGGTTRLVQLLGTKSALELLSTSAILNANELKSIGIASLIVKSEKMLSEALRWAKQHTNHKSSVIRSIKEATFVAGNIGTNYENALISERKVFCPLWGGKANKEALDKHIKHVQTS